MSPNFTLRPAFGALLVFTATLSQAAGLGPSGYAQSFDSMGAVGTAPPDGWALFTGPAGTSNGTWTSSVTAAGVAAMTGGAGAGTTASETVRGSSAFPWVFLRRTPPRRRRGFFSDSPASAIGNGTGPSSVRTGGRSATLGAAGGNTLDGGPSRPMPRGT